MARLIYLHDPRHAAQDGSVQLLPDAFRSLGWQVDTGDTGSLSLHRRRLTASGSLDNAGSTLDLASADLLWLGGFGPRGTFLDRMQLLAGLPGAQFVNHPSQLVMRHGKLSMIWLPEQIPQPESHASTDADSLMAVIASGGRWVAKPPGGSQGRDVFLLEPGAPNNRVILEHLAAGGSQQVLVQRFVPAASEGELRVLLAAGELVGCYHRQAVAGHRNNLHRGGTAKAAVPSTRQRQILQHLAKVLAAMDVHWAGVDLAGEVLLEVNLVSPGGLMTLQQLGDADAPNRTAAAISRWRSTRPAPG